ncbi:alpha/beta hydrolase [Sphingomonas sp. BT-65]|uniref:alpha/beta hydrolase n=1 Tax=Sphingomonas sp. BT-65 TaxID=2989821 RepID=UPI0022367342|nr:alpha/beta hydrolase [Sphingomonas sp. BT-65]MCW4461701.1 alpha/beta hydrolase [Sphingomonas sp. BT-65]
MRRAFRFLCTVLALAAASGTSPAVAQNAAPAIHQLTTRMLAAPDGRQMEITIGFVRVPEQRDAAGSETRQIELATIRLRWTGAAAASAANMLLAGGPGDSGTRLLSGLPAPQAASLLDLMGGDVIAFDQRGTGRSQPSLALPDTVPLPLETPGSPAAWLPLIDRAARLAAARFAAEGVRLASYTTVESTDDVEAVRRAFGYARVNLWGRSYGSHLALATVRRHPGSIARVILVSPEGPDHTLKLPAQTDAAIARIAARAGAPELPANMRKVFERLRRAPVTLSVADPLGGAAREVTVGEFDLQLLTAQALGDPRLLATLPIAFREMAAGKFERIGPAVLMMRTRYRLGSAMKYMMDLASYASPARLGRIREQAGSALLGNAMNFPLMDLRGAWPAADLGNGYRATVRSDVPTLILAGDLDARTPVENAREIAAGLPRAQVVVVENAAHEFDLFGNSALRPLLQDFLADRPVRVKQVALPPIPFQR